MSSMKPYRHGCSIGLLLLAALSARGQVGEQLHDFSIGANGGINLSQISFTPKISQHYLMGPTAGLTLRYTSERYFGILCAFQAELNLNRVGWKEDIHAQNNEKLPDTYERELTYVSLPILAHLGFGRKDRGAKGYLVAGPQLSLLIQDREKRSGTWTTLSDGTPNRTNNVVQQYGKKVENKFEYGITAGLGCELSSKIGHFMLEGRYYLGLSNLYGNSKTDPFAESGQRTIVAKITYLFDVSKR